MALARGFEPKTCLTHQDKLRVAYFHLINGWSQQDLAAYEGVNPGRVNEAIQVVREAVGWPEE